MAVWHSALLADMAHEAALTGPRKLSSIFFGGGTPSLMPPALVEALIYEAERLWGFTADVEITLEANPSSVEAARFADLGQAGVNRVSLGLQALDDAQLKFLGRAHDVDEGLAALATAQAHFARVSFDLIYALPDQSEAAWDATLRRGIGFGTTHLSLYQLTIEPGTRFETLVRTGAITPADEERSARLFELTRAITAAARMPAYEISNHAAPGQESRHNLTYWRYGDYIGIGPGAHGRRAEMATQRHKKPENFLSAIARNAHGLLSEIPLDPVTRGSEALIMGLRLDEGVDLADIAARTGVAAAELVDRNAVTRLASLGLIAEDGDRLQVTDAGMLLLDAILPELIADIVSEPAI